jgi:ABC-type uncharacterized transport system permease subunit
VRFRVAYAAAAIAASTAATALALLLSMIIIAIAGASPVDAMRALYEGAFGNRVQIAGTLTKMIPLVLVALGWIVAFSTNRINIGFEGQILIGGAAAAFIGLEVTGLAAPLHLGLALLVGVIAGGAYALIAAWLWARQRDHLHAAPEPDRRPARELAGARPTAGTHPLVSPQRSRGHQRPVAEDGGEHLPRL